MKSIRRRTWWLLALAVARPAGDAGAQVSLPVLTPQSSGTQVLLQAVSPVNRDVVWASGHRGTFVRTTDGGATWTPGV
ncbi:MAG TPA: hypothetical protein VD793_06410, partial [Gemmatimonadales bacterium]|nr:hypothetical protein [Gemmatimonadales bacterium]